jgi:signal peptidase I
VNRRYVAIVVALAAIAGGAVLLEGQFPDHKNFRVPSESMEPTLPFDTIIKVDRSAYDEGDPRRNDIVVFNPPKGADLHRCGKPNRHDEPCAKPTRAKSDTKFIKRIVGLPDDRLSIRGGRTYIDGVAQGEEFTKPGNSCRTCNLEREITIPPDHYFMMGDNRGASADSREWGPIPRDWLIGKVTGSR